MDLLIAKTVHNDADQNQAKPPNKEKVNRFHGKLPQVACRIEIPAGSTPVFYL
jgi:hypothetical protein